MVRSLAKIKRIFGRGNSRTSSDYHDLIDTIVNKAIMGLSATDDPTFADVTADSIALDKIHLLEQSAPPSDPIGGKAILYLSDGTVSDEAAGDLILLVSSPAGSGAVTKKIILADFSAS